MPLHLVKLSVGSSSVKDHRDWVNERVRQNKAKGLPALYTHVTRMTPKREEELLDGGSIYWVIKGMIAARQKLVGLERFRDSDGIGRCRLTMRPKLIAVSPRPMRPFQGWRYLDDNAVPPDLGGAAASIERMPEPMRRELRELGLL